MKAYLKMPGSAGFESSVPFDAKESLLWWQEKGLTIYRVGIWSQDPDAVYGQDPQPMASGLLLSDL